MKSQKKLTSMKQEINFKIFQKLCLKYNNKPQQPKESGKIVKLIEKFDFNLMQLSNFQNSLKKHLASLSEQTELRKNKICSEVITTTIFNLITPECDHQSYYNENYQSESSTEKSQLLNKEYSAPKQGEKIKNLINGLQKNGKKNMKMCYSQISTNSQRSTSVGKYFIKKQSTQEKGPKLQKHLKLDDFHLLNYSGQGVFGKVYMAKHKQSNFTVALKKIDKNNLTQDIKECLIREIKLHSQLDHPNIVKMYNFFTHQNYLYLVLEACTSGNLYEQLQADGSFSQQRVKSIIRQVCSGVQYLHSKNIMHRDLKAQNIVIHEKQVKICDFGWAIQQSLSDNSLCGTPVYVSPQVLDEKQYNRKIDIWSIGILTYELLYKKVPFKIQSQQDFQRVIKQQIVFPKSVLISQECQDFLRKCLQKNPQNRYEASQLLEHKFLKRC